MESLNFWIMESLNLRITLELFYLFSYIFFQHVKELFLSFFNFRPLVKNWGRKDTAFFNSANFFGKIFKKLLMWFLKFLILRDKTQFRCFKELFFHNAGTSIEVLIVANKFTNYRLMYMWLISWHKDGWWYFVLCVKCLYHLTHRYVTALIGNTITKTDVATPQMFDTIRIG